MQIRKFRWSKVYESSEEELVELFAHKHISARRWELGEDEKITGVHPIDTQLWCAEGQLRCTIAGNTYSLQPGDVLDIPAGLTCNIQAGFGGCACYESAAAKNSHIN
ncbi:MAG TPA: hypothetical protein VLI54_04290 [Bacillota bacterium]|nr:hypothetical protein [Bacillota bacterium]